MNSPRDRRLGLLTLAILLSTSACAQSPTLDLGPTRTLGPCEGCEAVLERPAGDLGWQLAVAPEGEPGEPLVLSGRALRADGSTPAPGVVLYVHHTNAEGVYAPVPGTPAPGATGWARRHGHLRGWLVTGPDGRYEVRTIRPAPYPDRGLPAHVHVFVSDGVHPPYYLNDVTFQDDPLVTPAYRASLAGRISPNVVTLSRDPDGSWRARHDLVLEY